MLNLIATACAATAAGDVPERSSNNVVTVFLILREPPAVDVWQLERKQRGRPAASNLARQRLTAIDLEHAALRRGIAALGARETGRFRKLANALRVQVRSDKLEALSRLPGVTRVQEAPRYHRATTTSVPHSGAPAVWTSRSTQADGKGVRVGIIDTGIDYTHAMFGGPGTEEAFLSNDNTMIEPGTFPTAKVVGGYDFAGDEYDAGDPAHNIPQPDPDPLDVYSSTEEKGHGTSVAGIAAGFGVLTDGTTYTGSYSNILDPAAFSIGPGVAPKTLLYALKVFGLAGTTYLVPDALEWAADPNDDGDFSDRLDVVNISIVGSFGFVSTDDVDFIVANKLVGLGCVMVVAAGNSGNTFYIAGGSGSVPRAISVANLQDFASAIEITIPPGAPRYLRAIHADFGPDPSTGAPIRGEVVYADPRDACGQLVNSAAVSGKIALIDRGTCFFVQKVLRAQEAGAIAVIVVNNVAGPPSTMGGGGDEEQVNIPSVMISQEAGQQLKSAAGPILARLNAPFLASDDFLYDVVHHSSSRGPLAPNHLLKPEISAPGNGVFTSQVGTGNDGAPFSGTSSAAPHVTGAAALLKQLHPGWSPQDIKAALMNTAGSVHDTNGVRYPESRVGAGRLQVDLAASLQVTAAADAADGRVALTFGALELVEPATITQRVRLSNHGPEPITFNIVVSNTVTESGVSIAPSTQSVSVPRFGAATVDFALSAAPALFDRTFDLTTPALLGNRPRAAIYEVSGQLWFINASNTIHLPYYAIVRAAAEFRSPGRLPWPNDANPIAVLSTSGRSAHPEPLVSAFQLGYLTNSLAFDPATAPADLLAVGAACNVASVGNFTNSMIFFGLVTAQPWTTPQQYSAGLRVDIDNDFDGFSDAIIYNTSLGNVDTDSFVEGRSANDVLVTAVRRDLDAYPGINLNYFPPDLRDTVLFNTRVLVEPVPVASLGLTPANSRFAYRVRTFGNPSVISGIVKQTPWITFDAARPGLDTARGLEGTPFFPDGGPVTVAVNRHAFNAYPQHPAILLLHHMNTVSNQMEIIPFAPRVSIMKLGDDVVLTWPEPGPYTVQTSPSIGPAAPWQDLTTTATNQYRFSAHSSASRFFRLQSRF